VHLLSCYGGTATEWSFHFPPVGYPVCMVMQQVPPLHATIIGD